MVGSRARARSFSLGKLGNSPNDRASRVRIPHGRITSYPRKLLILIDGTERDKCAKSALAKVREGGYIYLDNTDKVDNRSGDIRIAEETLLNAAKEKEGQVKYFVDLIPTYVAVTQGQLVNL